MANYYAIFSSFHPHDFPKNPATPQVNSKCAQVFESLDMEASEREQLYVQFDHFLKDKIYVNFVNFIFGEAHNFNHFLN